MLTVSPVPHGFSKVVGADGAVRGFVRMKPKDIPPIERAAERQMDSWAVGLIKELETAGILKAGTATEAETAVVAARAAGPGTVLKTAAFQVRVLPLLPEDGKRFVEGFVAKAVGSKMHGDHRPGTKVQKGTESLFWIHVVLAQFESVVGANW